MARGSNLGSRNSRFGTGMTSRFRETAFLLDISVGACLLERLKSRRSLRPSFRSSASLFSQPSSPMRFLVRSLGLPG